MPGRRWLVAGAALAGAAAAPARAIAGDPALDWGTLYDARLVEIADGTTDNAVKLYLALAEDRPPTDPLYAMTMFWLGRSQLATGNVDVATASLRAATGDPIWREPSLSLLEEAQLRREEIASLPARWNFESGTFPAVRGWIGAGRGQVGVRREGDRIVYSWGTTVRPGEPDRLTIRFGQAAALREVDFTARSVQADAVLRVVAVDAWGERWATPEIAVSQDQWTDMRIFPAEFDPVEASRGPLRLDRVVDLTFEDISGERSDVRGENTILLDDVAAI